MEQATREDIAAAAAAHAELGPGYEGALAESLVERIGAEIDKRVDARVGRDLAPLRPPEPPAPQPRAARSPWGGVVMGVGSMGLGIGATAAVMQLGANHYVGKLGNSVSGNQVLLVMVIWVVIAVVNVAYNRRR
jgi:hypothetical protein